jgi:hypothetical protein
MALMMDEQYTMAELVQNKDVEAFRPHMDF